ncbi:MAG: hypothetical protein ACRDWE_12125 [Acidimicrobiales bacterium]
MEPSGIGEDRAAEWRDALGADAARARELAYVRAFQLVKDVQTPLSGTTEEISALLSEARANDWPEVVRAAMFADAAQAHERGAAAYQESVQRMLSRAETDGAPVMIALALAMRATRATTVEGEAQFAVSADDDLVRASVILESADGPVIERISAHNSCAMAYAERWLWEIADDQYATALKLAPDSPAPWAQIVLPAVVYNRAEMQVTWACILRQLGDDVAVQERWETWQTVMAG